MVSIEVISRSKSLKGLSASDEFSLDAPVSLIVEKLSSVNKISVNRIRLTYKDSNSKQVPLNTDKSLFDNGFSLKENIALYAKDLGPQLGWRTVYIIEYLGPLLIHPLFYYIIENYNQENYTQTQYLAFVMATLHFLKREYETIFIHKFSNATMPFFNIFKNSGHYWILSGFLLAFFIFKNSINDSFISKILFQTNDFPSSINYTLFGLWAWAELSNLKCHLTLASLRSNPNDKKYVIPYGYGFNWCSAPNYFFESLSWVFFAILVGNWSAWLFLAVGTIQMYIWAIQRHKRYLKLFGDDYKKLKRSIMVPFLI